MQRTAITSIAILSLLAPFAASSATLTLTKPQAVARALAENRSLQAARTTIEQAQARRSQTGRLDDPEIRLEHASDWAFRNEGQSTLSLGLEQKFPITNRLRLLRDIADVEIRFAETEVRNQERLLAQEVESACIEIAHADAQLQHRQSLIELNREFAAFIDSRVRSGETSPIEANQIKIELFAIEQEVQQLKSEQANRLAALKPLLGLESSASLNIDYALERSPAEPALPPFEQAQLSNHPEYQLKEILLELSGKRSALALASRWQDVTVALSFENERSIDAPVGLGTDRFFGVSVSVPLPVRGRHRGAVQESLAIERQVAFERESASLNLRGQAESLRQKASSVYRQIHHYDTTMTQLVERNLADMKAAYSSGQISLAELFRSQEQHLKVQSAHVSIIRDYEQTLAEWRAATARTLANR